ncbi:Protein bassoon [Liparis tanakae]|uniref:Protein bassoon n=1 Tax=Liparis tanakae TaxID=230148 RepID=A0A4Z2J2D5_9TELE|nr:Protein bassoon [Liparis tanakae]
MAGMLRPTQSDPGPKAGVQSGHGTGDRLASHDTRQQAAPQAEQGQGHVSRKSLHVDVGSSRTGRSPSVSPDRGSVPTSPYSVPQIAPMPSSKLCPVCKTTDLMGNGDDKPNSNTCTQCRSMVCTQCGFNPNPHLTEIIPSFCLHRWPGPEKPQLRETSLIDSKNHGLISPHTEDWQGVRHKAKMLLSLTLPLLTD